MIYTLGSFSKAIITILLSLAIAYNASVARPEWIPRRKLS
jgi:hypothetical protein